MSGTKEGAIKTSKTNKEKYGHDYYAKIGKLGGKAKVPKGFALMTADQRIEAGRKGGTRSKRS